MNDPLPFSLPGVFSTVAATSSESRRHSFIRTVSSWPSCGQSGGCGRDRLSCQAGCYWRTDQVYRTNPAKFKTPTGNLPPSLMKTPAPSKTSSADSRSPRRAGSPAPACQSAVQSSPGKAQSARRILLVDDDPTVRDSVNNVLASEGYFVIPAENGQQALDLMTKSSVDLVLLDLNMPVKNGWDAFEQLTREHPLIPIIIVTARPNQVFTAISAGVGALLEKPMDIPTLLRTMEQLLAESAEKRLARLAGKETEFHYKAAHI